MKIILELNTEHNNIAEEFGIILFQELNIIEPISLRKKILSCSIELIQNNLKHNTKPAIFRFVEHNDYYKADITEALFEESFQKLCASIELINSQSINELKIKYQENLTKDSTNTGNGLILCRLKSSDTINYRVLDSDTKDYKNICISIKFKKS